MINDVCEPLFALSNVYQKDGTQLVVVGLGLGVTRRDATSRELFGKDLLATLLLLLLYSSFSSSFSSPQQHNNTKRTTTVSFSLSSSSLFFFFLFHGGQQPLRPPLFIILSFDNLRHFISMLSIYEKIARQIVTSLILLFH